MRLEEAIKSNSDVAFRLEREGFEEWAKAVLLGIEALKWWQKYQRGWVGSYKPELPGETKD